MCIFPIVWGIMKCIYKKKKKKLDSIIINFRLVSVMFPKPQGYNFWHRKSWKLGDIPGSWRTITAKCRYILALFILCIPPICLLSDMSKTGDRARWMFNLTLYVCSYIKITTQMTQGLQRKNFVQNHLLQIDGKTSMSFSGADIQNTSLPNSLETSSSESKH